MVKSFKTFAEEQRQTATITFGRFNPPTVGHEKLIDAVHKIASGKDYRIYVSQSEDSRRDPLPYDAKIKFMRAMFPKHGRAIINDRSIKNILSAAVAVSGEGYNELRVVVGSDRITEFRKLLSKYNRISGVHGLYNFNVITVLSAGDRDPDAEGVSGMSASKMRAAALADDYTSFNKGLPLSYRRGRELFNAVRAGMGLSETYTNHIDIRNGSVDEIRESYFAGDIGRVGDTHIYNNETYIITHRHTNFVTAAQKSNPVVTTKIFIKDL